MRHRQTFVVLVLGFTFASACDKKSEPADDSVIQVSSEDEAMNQAVAQARAHLHVFEEALKKKETGKSYDIKASFPAPDGNNEIMWLVDVTVVEGGFEGRLDNEPQAAKDLVIGKRYTVKRDDVRDWQITDDQFRVWGNYTLRVLLPRLDPEQRKALKVKLQPLP